MSQTDRDRLVALKKGLFPLSERFFPRLFSLSDRTWPSLRARGTKTRETSSQQPLHAISAGSPFLQYGCLLAITGTDT